MNTNQDNTKSPQDEMRSKLLIKLIPTVRKKGFQSLRMDEIAKYMDISKATMYKYFASKEEIIEGVVNSFVQYINELTVQSLDTVQSFDTKFRQLFEQAILLAAYISDTFLDELKVVYPDLYNSLKEAMKRREDKILSFYQEGKEKGIFNDVNERLIFLQEDVLVRAMLDMKFLMLHHMTLNQVLLDFYKLIKLQLFKAEKLEVTNDSDVIQKIDYMTQKITRDLL
ncbi:TetR/AcrR family transcriptional regulator [Priestia megaterium]|uniref:TetR/AcrR family transcriptional regulator n=1 Tax=Priestia megaterium TaxID=1404 RepID=UPI001BE69171|nr:TetR/AcrR family transcriptional regulator [Priestia megaterium]MBT2259233.1 TetR/AcrR family transcriptional regulator [Priestia megaterium]